MSDLLFPKTFLSTTNEGGNNCLIRCTGKREGMDGDKKNLINEVKIDYKNFE